MKSKGKPRFSKKLNRKTQFNIFAIIFLGISAIALAWFLTWYRTNFRSKAAEAPGTYPRPVRVLVLKYLAAPNQTHENFIKQRVSEWETQMERASSYHLYKNANAKPVIDVQVRTNHITRYGTPPLITNPDGSHNTDASFKAIVEANNNEVCNIINNEKIDQVWYMITPDAILEETGGYGAEWYMSNIFDTDPTKALCGKKRSFISLTLSTETGRENSLHVLGHFMEHLMAFTQTAELLHGRFEGTGYIWNGPADVYRNNQVCGDIHFSPNANTLDHDYDYYQPRQVTNNMCEDWHPNIADAATNTISSIDWKCSATECKDVDYYEWWFNNMPGKDNVVSYNGKKIPPWFEFLSDYDRTVEYYASNPEYFLDPYFNDKARPFYITNKSLFHAPAGRIVSWEHETTGDDRLLVVAVAYHTEHDDGTDPVISTVTYGTTPLTYIRRDIYGGFVSEIWYLKNPPLGKKNMSVTFPVNNTFGGIVASGTTFVGVDQTNPIRGHVGAGVANTSFPSNPGHQAITIPSQRGDYIFAILNTRATQNSATRAGVTAGLWDGLDAEILSKGGTQLASSTSTILEWNSAQNWRWAASGLAIKPKNVATPTPTPTPTVRPTPTPTPTVRPTPTLVPSPSTAPLNGLRGVYYDNVNFTERKGARLDQRFAFNWATAAPIPAMDKDTFSIRWTGFIKAPVTGKYTFYAKVNDGVRVVIKDGLITKTVINSWTKKTTATEVTGTINLTKNKKYSIRVDYFDDIGAASLSLMWSYPNVTKRVIPVVYLTPQ